MLYHKLNRSYSSDLERRTRGGARRVASLNPPSRGEDQKKHQPTLRAAPRDAYIGKQTRQECRKEGAVR